MGWATVNLQISLFLLNLITSTIYVTNIVAGFLNMKKKIENMKYNINKSNNCTGLHIFSKRCHCIRFDLLGGKSGSDGQFYTFNNCIYFKIRDYSVYVSLLISSFYKISSKIRIYILEVRKIQLIKSLKKYLTEIHMKIHVGSRY